MQAQVGRPISDHFRIADHPGAAPFVDTSAFIGTNPAFGLSRRLRDVPLKADCYAEVGLGGAIRALLLVDGQIGSHRFVHRN